MPPPFFGRAAGRIDGFTDQPGPRLSRGSTFLPFLTHPEADSAGWTGRLAELKHNPRKNRQDFGWVRVKLGKSSQDFSIQLEARLISLLISRSLPGRMSADGQ